MNKCRTVQVIALTLLAWSAAATPGPIAVAVPLPPLAKVCATDASGATWQQSGQMSGTVEYAQREFAMTLGAAGWRLDKTIVIGRPPARSQLMVWTRGKQRILFMVWEKEAGTCGFSWGTERQ